MIVLIEWCHNVSIELDRAMKLHGYTSYEEIEPGDGYRRFRLK
jgi:hypothetical protein